MQLFATDRGVVRRTGDSWELVAASVHLSELIAQGRLGEVVDAPAGERVRADELVLDAPVRPTRLFQVGLNYHSHLAEIGQPVPARLIYGVTGVTDQISPPGSSVAMPTEDPDAVDHECEIAVVIARPCRSVDVGEAWDVVAGVTAANDVSARGLQRAGLARGELSAGKMLPGFKPLGPGLITADEARAAPIPVRLEVNGEVRQQSDTQDMVHSIPELVALISAEHDLVAGDVVMTGSPAGVGAFTGRFLRPGDVTEVFVGDLPALRTTFHLAG